jgi:hypothetical protein
LPLVEVLFLADPTIARAYGPYEAFASTVWFTIAAPSTNQPMHLMSAHDRVGC